MKKPRIVGRYINGKIMWRGKGAQLWWPSLGTAIIVAICYK
jgi:hypothetical protein